MQGLGLFKEIQNQTQTKHYVVVTRVFQIMIIPVAILATVGLRLPSSIVSFCFYNFPFPFLILAESGGVQLENAGNK